MNSRTNIDPVKTKAKRIKCEKEHLFFTRAFFLPRMGFKFSVNWHHEYIADKIDEVIAGKVKNLVINVPPGSGKTELLTNLIARGIARNPRSRFLYLSFSQSLVEDVSATARNIVKSEDFQNLWPVKISTSTDAKSSWKTTVDGYDAGHVYSA
ncbi:DEAD/DEAH box helicase family protein, partial [Acinetobacter baumannii]